MDILKQKKIFAALLIGFGLFVFASPNAVNAQKVEPKGGLVPCGGYNVNGTPEKPCTFLDIFVIVARTTNWLISIAGMYAVFKIVQAGFWLTVSQGDEEAISTNKKSITNSIIGLVLTFMAFMLINTVVNFILAGGKPGYQLDLTNPTCYLAPTTQNECFIEKKN